MKMIIKMNIRIVVGNMRWRYKYCWLINIMGNIMSVSVYMICDIIMIFKLIYY